MKPVLDQVRVVDSHTGGEPTRVVVAGGPDLGAGTLREKLERFRQDYDDFRAAVILEPRGSDVIVGALLLPPQEEDSTAATIFFNNTGYLGMCGHGTIGLVTTLAWMGRIAAGAHLIETPVGKVKAVLHENGEVTVENVPSFRTLRRISVPIGDARVTGDVAWGGNWFFLTSDHNQRIAADNVEQLGRYAWRLRQALEQAGITGAGGATIDHIELFGPPSGPHADSRNFVLCPGLAYDRSPCGTGTSAKVACLAEDGLLAEGQIWRQESIVGSIFQASYRRQGDRIIPWIRGSAHIYGETTLFFDPRDPFRLGIRR